MCSVMKVDVHLRGAEGIELLNDQKAVDERRSVDRAGLELSSQSEDWPAVFTSGTLVAFDDSCRCLLPQLARNEPAGSGDGCTCPTDQLRYAGLRYVNIERAVVSVVVIDRRHVLGIAPACRSCTGFASLGGTRWCNCWLSPVKSGGNYAPIRRSPGFGFDRQWRCRRTAPCARPEGNRLAVAGGDGVQARGANACSGANVTPMLHSQ